jgi:hypothetical protein
MHGLVALFLGVIALAIILLVVGLVALCNLVVGSTTIVVLIILMSIVRVCYCCDCVGRFDGNCGTCDCNDDGSSIHDYARQEDEPFSFPLAASCPWQSS